MTPLMVSVAIHNEDFFILLLRKGANPDILCPLGFTALHYAVFETSPVFVRNLLEVKANPNVSLPKGFTALQIAACNNIEAVVKLLLSAGALATPVPADKPNSHNRKVSEMIGKLASEGDLLCSKLRCFLELEFFLEKNLLKKYLKCFMMT